MMELRGVAQRQRAWFGTRRSAVQIRPPRPWGEGGNTLGTDSHVPDASTPFALQTPCLGCILSAIKNYCPQTHTVGSALTEARTLTWIR